MRLSRKAVQGTVARKATGLKGPLKFKRFDHADSFMALWRMRAAICPVEYARLTEHAEIVRECRFAPGRNWRFDVAWPELSVAVELEGGHWSNHSRHTRGSGFAGDCEKYSTAAALGWRVLRFTGDDLKKRPSHVIALVLQALCYGRKPAAVPND